MSVSLKRPVSFRVTLESAHDYLAGWDFAMKRRRISVTGTTSAPE